MADGALPPGLRPDFYIAAMGRSGSTMLANWLSNPPDRIVFNEPFFLRPANSRLLRIQLANLGMAVPDDDWLERDDTPLRRFARIMVPRLRGRRWAAKEVLCEEHDKFLEAFAPPRVLISVRHIVDVALSLFEKHRVQGNLDRYPDHWVGEYCRRESEGLVDFADRLKAQNVPFLVVRYEEFTASLEARARAAGFTGWPGDGDPGANLADFDRGFEADRHSGGISGGRERSVRHLGEEEVRLAAELGENCARYQNRFGYSGLTATK